MLIINILFLTQGAFGRDAMTWDAAETTYQKARFVVLLYSTVTLSISCLFDAVDTIMYYFGDRKEIQRSEYTINLIQKASSLPK